MLKSPYLFAVSVLVALIQWAGVANAQDLNVGLSFELPPVAAQAAVPTAPPDIPPAMPPALSKRSAIATAPVSVELAPIELAPVKLKSVELTPIELTPIEPTPIALTTTDSLPIETADSDGIALTFATNTVSLETTPTHSTPDSAAAVSLNTTVAFSVADSALSLDDWIFERGTHSLVAHTVGSAEGTRRADGQRTQAYYGHTDPGNGVWNLGTFSYQHEANSPEDADEKQLQRLKRQGIELEAQATQLGITLSLDEKLNGIDLANQAPLAALDTGGYIDRLAQAKRLQMKGDDAILWARTHAYIDPDTRRWNAPGLGNNVHSISKDQERRMSAIATALKAYNPVELTIDSLANLEPVSLTHTGSATSTSLTDNTYESSQPLFGDISTGLEISFGLPPTPFNTMANGVTTDGVTAASAETVVAADSATLAQSAEQNASEQNASEQNASEQTDTEQTDTEQKEVLLSNIGITFDSTENIADPVAIASSLVHEIKSVNETEATDLFSISRSEAETESAQPHNIPLNSTIETTVTAIPDIAIAENMAPQRAIDSDSNTRHDESLATTEDRLSTAPEAIANSSVVEEDTAGDDVNRLESLLTGVSTIVEPDTLSNLKNDRQHQEPGTNRRFFRTEDKIVPNK